MAAKIKRVLTPAQGIPHLAPAHQVLISAHPPWMCTCEAPCHALIWADNVKASLLVHRQGSITLDLLYGHFCTRHLMNYAYQHFWKWALSSNNRHGFLRYVYCISSTTCAYPNSQFHSGKLQITTQTPSPQNWKVNFTAPFKAHLALSLLALGSLIRETKLIQKGGAAHTHIHTALKIEIYLWTGSLIPKRPLGCKHGPPRA